MSADFQIKKNNGVDLNSYDVLKAFGIIIMMIDHAGAFFPQQFGWMRTFGFAESVWFFLIGYAGTRPIPKEWIIGGGAVLLASMMVAGSFKVMLPILFTFMIIRLCVDKVGSRASSNSVLFLAVILFLIFVTPYTLKYVEYGTYALACGLFGYIRRHKDELAVPAWAMTGVIAALVLSSSYFQLAEVPLVLPLWACGFIVLARLAVFIVLYRFERVTWPRARRIPGMVPALKFLARWALEIYVIHMLIVWIVLVTIFIIKQGV